MENIELLVQDLRISEEGETLIIGLVTNRKELELGTRFLTKHEIRPYVLGSEIRDMTPINVATVDLVVTKIITFQKEVDFVPIGWSAGLSLSGTGLEHVKKGCYLLTGKL